MYSTPAVGSCVLPPRAKRPERNGTVSTRNGFVLLNQIEKTLGEVLVRDPCRFRESWRGGARTRWTFRSCHVLRTGSRVCFDVLSSVEVVMQKTRSTKL
ncbi:MAG TPA: hypothetical protein DDX19_05465 [Rhodopirellula baltica]|nr:hypothetical protein [Rhodopirellula baltica]